MPGGRRGVGGSTEAKVRSGHKEKEEEHERDDEEAGAVYAQPNLYL